MKSSGNGTLNVCVNNLLRTVRGEVPYDRIKGLDARLVDKPMHGDSSELAADAEWVIDTWEPRARLEGLSITPNDAGNGGFTVVANVKEREG